MSNGSNTWNTSHHHVNARVFDATTNTVYMTLSLVMIVFGILMNVVVVFLYVRKKIQRSRFNFSLLHLSASNIAQHIGLLPHLIIDLKQIPVDVSIITETLICSVTDGLTLFFMFASTSANILCFITITRYLVIKNPIKNYINGSKNTYLLCTMWLLGVIFLLPNALSWKLDHKNGFCVRGKLYSNQVTFRVYAWSMLIVGLVVPVFLMVWTYSQTVYRFYIKKPDEAHGGIQKIKYRKQVTALLGALIIVYLLSWLPYSVYWTLSIQNYFGTGINAEYKKSRIMRLTLLPCLGGSMMNVIFYGLSNYEFRQKFLTTILSVIKLSPNPSPNRRYSMKNITSDQSIVRKYSTSRRFSCISV